MSRLLILVILFAACGSQRNDLSIPAKKIKQFFSKELNDFEKIDTLYITVTPFTAQDINIMQAAEYTYTVNMLKKQKSPDSLLFESVDDRIIGNSNNFDSIKVVYYRLAAMLTYISKDKSLRVAEKWFFIDKSDKLIDKYKIVKQISPFDNNEIRTYLFDSLNKGDIDFLRHDSSLLKF